MGEGTARPVSGSHQTHAAEFGKKDNDNNQADVDDHHERLQKIDALQSLDNDFKKAADEAAIAKASDMERGQQLDKYGRLCTMEGRASVIRKNALGEFELEFGDGDKDSADDQPPPKRRRTSGDHARAANSLSLAAHDVSAK